MNVTFRSAATLHVLNRGRRGAPIVARHLQVCVECAVTFALSVSACPGCGTSADSALSARPPLKEHRELIERLAASRQRDYQNLRRIRESLGRLKLAS